MNNFSLPGGHRRSSFSKQQLHSLIYGKACDIPSLTPQLPAATAYTPMFRHQQGFRLVVPSTGAAVEEHQSQRGGRGKLDKLLSGKSATRNALRWA